MAGDEPGAVGDVGDAISIEQYAGITAALADALPLRFVLDNEGLDEAAWRPLDIAWKARVGRTYAASCGCFISEWLNQPSVNAWRFAVSTTARG